MGKEKRRQFDHDFKVEILRLITEGERPVPEAAKDYDMGEIP
ncbi:MAG: hypothetical protein NTX88_08495 [Candidatus Atribacteria bacterium]|nr:hypothetical protein [Candidatus Atribacteria bacterium]